MASPLVSPRVLKFVAEKIDSVAELEALLILSEDENRSWSAQEIAARLYVEPASAVRALNALVRRALVAVEGAPVRYRFSPVHSDDRDAFTETAETYRHNLVAIATFIHSKTSAAVTEFARAFDLKKEQ